MSGRRLRELVLDVTNRCPMKCLHCSANSSLYLQDFISPQKASQIIKEAVILGLERLSFSGGEPLMHPQIVKMVHLSHSLGVRDIRIFTSALKSKGSEIVPMDETDAKSLAEAGLTRIFFNLHGASAKAHERIAGTPGAFEAVMSASKCCRKHRIHVGFQFVPMKPNWDEIAGISSIARAADVDEIGVLRFVAQGRGKLNRDILEMDAGEFRDLLLLTSEQIGEYDRPRMRLGCPFNSISELIPKWKMKRCPAASEMCHVLIDGTVAPCSAFKHDVEMKSANVYERSFHKIWQTGFATFTAERARLSAEYECTAQELRVAREVVALARITYARRVK